MADSATPVRILLVDQSAERAEALGHLLREMGYPEVRICDSSGCTCGMGGDLLDHVEQFRPDVVLLEIDNPKRDYLEQLATLQDQRPTPVAVFCQDAQAQSVRDAVQSGVCAYVVEGIQPRQVKPAIDLAMSTFGAFTRLKREAADARAELNDRKKIDRAKRRLMTVQNLSEQEAYDSIRKLAMDRQRKMSEAADDVLAMLKILDPSS